MSRERQSRRAIWSAAEDDVILTAPSRFTIQDLQKAIRERTGIERTERAVRKRRKIIKPDYALEPDGFIRLALIAAIGAKGTTISPIALREAKDAGVLRVTRINGRNVKVVPMKWADEWLGRKTEYTTTYHEAVANGWLPTSELCRELKKTKDTFWSFLRVAREKGIGTFVPLLDVPCLHVNSTHGDRLWEPTAARVAITKVRELENFNRKLRRYYWCSKRVAAFFGKSTYRAIDRNPSFKTLHDLRIERNTYGWRYWIPDEVRAWAKANGKQTEEDE